MNRREWLACVAASAACSTGHGHDVGVNLYTVRRPLVEAPERVLRQLAAVGCRYVEARLVQVEDHLTLLAELEMPWINWMIDTPIVTGNWDAWGAVAERMGSTLNKTTLEETITTANRCGVRNLGISYTLPAEREGSDGWERLADQCNQAGRKCKDAGLRFYFHNHAEEFVGEPGRRPFDRLLERLDPELVWLEIDVFWVSIAGSDPAEAIRRASGRVLSLHLKDKAAGTANVTSVAGAPLEATREVGAGALDWPGILSAAEEAGVERWLVEQDETPGDPVESVRESFEYLENEAVWKDIR